MDDINGDARERNTENNQGKPSPEAGGLPHGIGSYQTEPAIPDTASGVIRDQEEQARIKATGAGANTTIEA